MRTIAIIVAAGRGERLGGATPKQYLPLGEKLILMRTIDAFVVLCSDIVVVVPQGGVEHWEALCREYNYTTAHRVVEGDSERFYSVRNALLVVGSGVDSGVDSGADIVLVHDGVRPFVSGELIGRVIEGAINSGAVVPTVPIVDTLRRIGGGVISRGEVMAVQTPQGFTLELLQKAYRQPYTSSFTDDGSVVEAMGYGVEMVEGEVNNFKITTAHDFRMAQLLV